MAARTVRILSIDGGGMRGYMSAVWLKMFCAQAGINPLKLFESFDIITGTSVGGIQALGYAFGLSPQNLIDLLAQKGPYIFDPGIFTLPFYKERVVMGPSTSSYIYDNTKILDVVEDVIPPNTTLADLPGKVIITAWNRTTNLPTLFSNIVGYDFLSGSNELVSNVAAATASAPVYFQETSFSNNSYADGGVIQNNPTLIAYHVAQSVFPNANRYCVLSVGAGAAYSDVLSPSIPSSNTLLTSNGLNAQEQAEIAQEFREFKNRIGQKYPSLALDSLSDDLFGSILVPSRVQDLFYYLQNVFIGGVQQLVDDLMQFAAQDPYKSIYYYRFQHNFTQTQESALDETDSTYLAELASYAATAYTDDYLKISNFIHHFQLQS